MLEVQEELKVLGVLEVQEELIILEVLELRVEQKFQGLLVAQEMVLLDLNLLDLNLLDLFSFKVAEVIF